MGVFLGNLTIANGGTTSNSLGGRILRTIKDIEIHGPSALTGTVTVESADQLGETSFTTVQSGGSDVNVTAAKVLVLTEVPAHAIRVLSSGAEGAERVFPVFGTEKAHQ